MTHSAELASLCARNGELSTRQSASLEAWNRIRLSHLNDEIRLATDPKILRMKTAERARVELETQRQLSDLQTRSQTDLIRQRVAMGTIEIIAP